MPEYGLRFPLVCRRGAFNLGWDTTYNISMAGTNLRIAALLALVLLAVQSGGSVTGNETTAFVRVSAWATPF